MNLKILLHASVNSDVTRRAPPLSFPYPSNLIPFKGLLHAHARILLHTEHEVQYCHAVDFVGLSGYIWASGLGNLV